MFVGSKDGDQRQMVQDNSEEMVQFIAEDYNDLHIALRIVRGRGRIYWTYER
jgi:hypothetical protein